MQEVLLEVWRTAARFDPAAGSASAWVTTLAHRRDSRATRLAAILARLSPDHLVALDAARPALDALASVPSADDPARGTAR